MTVQFNQTIIGGNFARDPELRFLANERTVANFAIATNRRWKDAEGNTKEEATFIECQAWGKQADFIGKFFAKGSAVLIVGHLRQESWEDKTTGAKRSKLVLMVDDVRFADAKKDGARPAAGTAAAAPAAAPSSAPATSHDVARSPAGGDDEPPF